MKVKGNILKARIAFVGQHFGEDAWANVLAAMSDDDEKQLSGIITNSGWYPFDVAARLDEAIVKVLGSGRTQVFEDIGKASARANLGSVHKGMLTPGDPAAFMAKADMIYRFYYDTGNREYEPTGPKSGVLTTHGAETFSAADCATVVGWYREALKMCGATNVMFKEETCRAKGGEYCRYTASWS
ncbi:MAG: DUF2378 family protein [bacterium]|nr:DUF2378 family protein [bacterium]